MDFELESDEDEHDRIAMGGDMREENREEGNDVGGPGPAEMSEVSRDAAGLARSRDRLQSTMARVDRVIQRQDAAYDARCGCATTGNVHCPPPSDLHQSIANSAARRNRERLAAPPSDGPGPSGASAGPRRVRPGGLLRSALRDAAGPSASPLPRQERGDGVRARSQAESEEREGVRGKREKRVRFALPEGGSGDGDGGSDGPSGKRPRRAPGAIGRLGRRRSIVPDHVRNPSLYTAYEIDGVVVGGGIRGADSDNPFEKPSGGAAGVSRGGKPGTATAMVAPREAMEDVIRMGAGAGVRSGGGDYEDAPDAIAGSVGGGGRAGDVEPETGGVGFVRGSVAALNPSRGGSDGGATGAGEGGDGGVHRGGQGRSGEAPIVFRQRGGRAKEAKAMSKGSSGVPEKSGGGGG